MPTPFRSRQWAYQNPAAGIALTTVFAACVVLFFVTDAWAQAWWACALTLAIMAALLWIPLTIEADERSVKISLAGAMRREIALADVVTVERRRYSALRQFGGWGWRWGADGARAYTTKGDEAVVLTLRAGGDVYLGVDNPAALTDWLSTRIGA